MKKTVIGTLLLSSVLIALAGNATTAKAEEVKENDNVFYVVESGDTLSDIASKYGVDFTVVHGNNTEEVAHADVINVGQKLLVGGKDFDKDKVADYSAPVVQAPVEEITYSVEPMYTEPTYVEDNSVAYSAPVTQSYGGGDGSVAYASQRMADATGLSADYWEWIIMAESGGSSTISNPTGHYGYFQIAPVHGMPAGASVDTQIDYAINIYNSQGLGAWEVTH